MQPCKTGDQPYSDPSPNGECSLVLPMGCDEQKDHYFLIMLNVCNSNPTFVL